MIKETWVCTHVSFTVVAAYENDIVRLKLNAKKSVPCKQSTPRNVLHLLSHSSIYTEKRSTNSHNCTLCKKNI